MQRNLPKVLASSTLAKPHIVKDSEGFCVVYKPSGWITNESSTTGDLPVLQKWISENISSKIAKSHEFRSGIVHRLDKETSGLLIIAKTKKVFFDLQKQFKERKIKKVYYALVHGQPKLTKGNISLPVGRLPWRRDRFGVLPGGRESVTDYEVVDFYSFAKSKYTLMRLHPKTGRTHQLRIHLKHIGHPIVSDSFYAGRKTAKSDKLIFPRLFLHAGGIEFEDPVTGESVTVDTPLAPDLKSQLNILTRLE